MKGAVTAASVLPNSRLTAADEHVGLSEALAGADVNSPECIAHPETTEEVVELLRWASTDGVGVLPLCSARHVSLASAAQEGRSWIGVATDRLTGIEIYEAADLTVTAGAGTPMSTVDSALRENRQWAPFDPPELLTRSLGGLASDSAHGPLWMGYGELRNHILGMTVVTGDGRLLRLGGRVVKNVAGFDLLKPMTGSRGSLAVITSVTLRAFPEPAEDRVLTLSAATAEELFDAALHVGTAPVLPVSCVVTDASRPADSAAAGASLVVRLHGARTTVDADQRTLETHIGSKFDVITPEQRSALLGRVGDRGAHSPVCLEASARPSRLGALWRALNALDPIAFGIDSYAGLARVGLSEATPTTVSALTEAVEELGGAVRVVRAPTADLRRLGSRPSADEAGIIDRLRDAFDPEGVLWPARQ